MDLLNLIGGLNDLKGQLTKILPLLNDLIKSNIKLNDGEQFYLLVKVNPDNSVKIYGVTLVINNGQMIINRELFSKDLSELLDLI